MVANPPPRAAPAAGAKPAASPVPVKASLERLYRGVAAGLRVFADATSRRVPHDE